MGVTRPRLFVAVLCGLWGIHILLVRKDFFFFFFVLRAAFAAYGSSRLEIELELQPAAYTTATAAQNMSHICDLHRSAQQH